MKKYKLTKEVFGIKLYRIEATRSFGNVEKGEKGGFIEKEDNLSQEDNAWVSGDARVFGNASVSGDARVSGDACVSGDAWVFGKACVFGKARVYGNARVYGELKLEGGYFYHYKQKSEKIEEIEVEDDYVILCRGPKLGKEEKEISLKGKEVEVKLDGVTYKAIIK